MNIGDRIHVLSYGQAINGAVSQIGNYTGKASQMRRADNGKLRAIIPGSAIAGWVQ